MGTSTLRFAIIVALVLGGVLLIDQAFPEGQTESLPRPSETTTAPESPSPSATETDQAGDGGDGETQAPATKVVIGVYNGTFVTGHAGTTATQLSKKPAYRIPDNAVGDTPTKPLNQTTIYFRNPEDQAAAEQLVADYFSKRGLDDVSIEPMNDLDVPDSLDLAIYLGTDSV